MASDVSLGGTHLVVWLILRGTCGYCPCLCVHTLAGPRLTDSLCCTCSDGVPQPGQHLLAQAAPHHSHLCGTWSGGRQGGFPAVLLLTLTVETLVLCADTRLGNQRCWPVRVGVAVGAAT